MAWIESHQALGTHRKLLKLARVLGIGRPQAIGHLHLLWWWALDNAPDGNVADVDALELSEVCAWSGEPERFADQLRECGWIDNDGMLHDWAHYGGKYLSRLRKNAEKVAAWRNKNRHVTVTPPPPVTVTLPLRNRITGQDRTEEIHCSTALNHSAKAEAIYQAYPRHQGKGRAIKAITSALKRVASDRLLERTQAYAAAVLRWPPGQEQFIPLPATWYGQGRWDDDPRTWERIAPSSGSAGPSPAMRLAALKDEIAQMSEKLRLEVTTPGPERDSLIQRIGQLRQEAARCAAGNPQGSA